MKHHKKPRVKFCWHCGRKLWGRHHVELFIDGHDRTLHESCRELMEGGENETSEGEE